MYRSSFPWLTRQQHPLQNSADNNDGNNNRNNKRNKRKARKGMLSKVSNLISRVRGEDDNNESLNGVPIDPEEVVDELQTENKLLRETIRQLEIENEWLHSRQRVVLENFEGEGRRSRQTMREGTRGPANDYYYHFDGIGGGANGTISDSGMFSVESDNMDGIRTLGITLTEEEMVGDVKTLVTDEDPASLWCDELDGDSCPVEPTISFGAALRDRAYWLVGLLVMQSCSGIILARNEALLANHPIIIYFLTMLVGAGGNAGNQASVRGMLYILLFVCMLFVFWFDCHLVGCSSCLCSFPLYRSYSWYCIRNTQRTDSRSILRSRS